MRTEPVIGGSTPPAGLQSLRSFRKGWVVAARVLGAGPARAEDLPDLALRVTVTIGLHYGQEGFHGDVGLGGSLTPLRSPVALGGDLEIQWRIASRRLRLLPGAHVELLQRWDGRSACTLRGLTDAWGSVAPTLGPALELGPDGVGIGAHAGALFGFGLAGMSARTLWLHPTGLDASLSFGVGLPITLASPFAGGTAGCPG